MKNNIIKLVLISLSIITILIVFLSTVGIETNRFNNQIKNKIIQIDKNLDLDLKKIKLTLDPFKFKIYARTVGAIIFYSKKSLPLEYIESEVSVASLIKNKIISSNIELSTRSILLNDLISFIRATNKKPELFILEKIVKKGHIIVNLKFNIDDNGNIKNDYRIKGLIKNANINFLNKANVEKISFNFDLKKDYYLFNKIRFKAEDIYFISDKINIKVKKNIFLLQGIVKNDLSKLNLNVLKLLNLNFESINIGNAEFTTKNQFSLEIDKKFKFKNIILNSDININQLNYKKPEIIQNYFTDINSLILLENHKLKLNYKNKNLSIKGEGNIKLKDEIDEIKYLINKKGKKLSVNAELFLKNLNLKKQEFLEIYFPSMREKIHFKNQKLQINYKNKNLKISGLGKIKIDKDFEEITYFFEEKDNKLNFITEFNIKNTNFKIDTINYTKKDDTKMSLKIDGQFKDNKNLNINNFIIHENNNKVKIINLSLNQKNQIIKIDEAIFNYLDNENIKNNFNIKKVKDFSYIINGNNFNANSLITNLLKSNNKKKNNNFEDNLEIKLNIKKVYIDNIHFVKNLKGNLSIKNNEVLDANILAYFDNSNNISFSIKTNGDGEKITTLFSSKAKPLVDRYKFIKGFKDGKEGYLDFSSLKKNSVSNSKLIIDNFKVNEIPALAKLLALASLQGIADLLTGEGIRFTDFEMKFTNEDKLMRIQELYAIGPAISILLEGYIEIDRLISLRGTLVPATTINRSIASIPLIGDLLIGKKVGEGVFGVSFKIKGPPQNLETSVNPIKTLTPRFITRTLEKIKKN